MINKLFKSKNINFQILNEGITKEQIENVISQDFKGKIDLIQFYLIHDGVYFPEGAKISTEQFLKDDENEYYELEIEYIYSIEHINKMCEAIKERSEESKKFMETHFSFARDAAGNEFFIEIPTGLIKYISWEYDIEEGLIVVAHNFKEFYSALGTLI